MEESLKQIVKETAKVLKYTKVHDNAQDVLEFLDQKNNFLSYKLYQIRERCLEAFKAAIESKNQRLASFAVSGLQHMLKDAQMHSSESEMKEEELEQYFPVQILSILHSTSSLSEDVQVEVMRLLLNMSLSLPQSMSAAVVISVVKLCLESLTIASRQTVKNFVFNTFLRMIHMFSVKASDADSCERSCDEKTYIYPENSNENTLIGAIVPKEEDFVAVFQYICDNLSLSTPSCAVESLLLEGVLVLLSKLPPSISCLPVFHDLIWQKLCPTLISILANPMNDRVVTTSKSTPSATDEIGRGSCCSSNVPAVSSSSAKIIYSISMNLVKSLGRYASLRPVFESLFHRMLLYSGPLYRLDVIKSLKPLLSSPAGLVTLCGPMIKDDKEKSGSHKSRIVNDMRLIKIIMDSLQECSRCNDSSIIVASVELIDDFLSAIDALVKGGPSGYHELSENKSASDVASAAASNGAEAERREHRSHEVSEAEDTKDLVTRFVEGVCRLVPELCRSSDVLFADEIVLNFSSKFCQEMNFKESETILNADAVYMTTYSVLHLAVTLHCSDYYSSPEKSLPLSQDQFTDEILGTGLLLYVPRSWLREIFGVVISSDVLNLKDVAIDLRNIKKSPFLVLLNDLSGFSSHRLTGQMLSSFQDDLETVNSSNDFLFQHKGHQLAYNILTYCWDSILEVFSVLTGGKGTSSSNSSFMLLFNAKEETKKMRLAICISLEGLQKAARLSSILGLQNRSGSVFSLLASASCVVELDDIKKEKLQQQQQTTQQQNDNKSFGGKIIGPPVPPTFPFSRTRLVRLHAAHALSMEVLLGIGLEMGSHARDCWKNVFRCCAHISELEHIYFTSNNESLYSSMTKIQRSDNNCIEFISQDDGIESVEVYLTSASSACEPVAPQINVKEVIEQSRLESGWDINASGGGVLSQKQAAKVLCGLSQQVDKLFEDAATKLNMKSLVEFLSELCASSDAQLSCHGADGDPDSSANSVAATPTNALHLYRLADIMNRCIGGRRPLLHIMRAWSVVSRCLTKAACHKDQMISKKAVSCMHEIVTGLLSSRQELPLFHFNEFLCKPFESLLCLELCDGDVQDQIVCSICELVEACPCNLKSGWKPLFSALRSVKIECSPLGEVNAARQRHVAAVLDVFDVFLATDNILVFANAAVDCILCLLRYVKGPEEFEAESVDSDDGEEEEEDSSSFDGASHDNLCLPALKYLRQCAEYLASMWALPSIPTFSGAHRIHSVEFQTLQMLPSNMDINVFIKTFHDLEGTGQYDEDTQTTHPPDSDSMLKTKEQEENLTKPNGDENGSDQMAKSSDDHEESEICADKVVFVDAKLSSVGDDFASDPRDCNGDIPIELRDPSEQMKEPESKEDDQSSIDDGSVSSPDPLLNVDNSSGILHVYHLLIEGLTAAVFDCSRNYQPQSLETLFELIRSSSKVPGPRFAFHCFNNILLPTLQSWTRKSFNTSSWNAQVTSNCKHFTGLSTDLLVGFVVQFIDDADLTEHLEFMLHQQMSILIEFIAQPVEFLSRLGCSCIRHCLMNCGFLLNRKMWDVVVEAMKACFDVTIFNLRCLMVPFRENSGSFYGDEGQVKVAVRQDSTPVNSEKLQHLSRQVFLLDCQQDQNFEILLEVGSRKSFVFLIYSPSSLKKDVPLIRIPFRSLVISLVSHQLLIQTIGSLLLNGTSNAVPSEKVFLCEVPLFQNLALPGMLEMMSCKHVIGLLDCLKASFRTSEEFNQKPGLKFLIQKLLGSNVSANLYRHAGLGMTLYVHALFEVASHGSSKHPKADSDNHEPVIQNGKNDMDPQWNGSMFGNAAYLKGLLSSLEVASLSDLNVLHFVGLFAGLLKQTLDEFCSKYVDLFLEKEGPSISDRLSQSMLVFLSVEHDELPTLKREQSLKEAVSERLRRSSSLFEANESNSSFSAASAAASSISSSSNNNNNNQNNINSFSSRKNSKDTHFDEAMDEEPCKDKMKNVEIVEMSSLNQQLRFEADDKICKLASEHTLKSLVGEYRKRKQSRSMPNPSLLKSKFKLSATKSELECEINKQQNFSHLKDSEAHLRSRAEVLCNVLELLDHLNDDRYCCLLPIFHQSIVNLTKHSVDAQIRQSLSHWISRIARIYNFSGSAGV